MIRVQLWLVLFCVATSDLRVQKPSGYHLGAVVPIPDSLDEVFSAGRFRAVVRRSVTTPEDRQLVDLAERLYPNQEALLGAARNATDRDKLASQATGVLLHNFKFPPRAAGTPVDRWWLDAFDGTWTPFAVTGSAVDYYLARLRDLAAGRGQFTYPPGTSPDRGSFFYQATVRPGSEPGIAKVVELQLSWDYWCGTLCAISFTHTRLIFFDARGSVVRITGDRRPDITVS